MVFLMKSGAWGSLIHTTQNAAEIAARVAAEIPP